MNGRRPAKLAVALGACVLLGSAVFGQAGSWQVERGQVSVKCPLTVGGSFDARTEALSGRLVADASRPSAFTGELAVDLQTLDTGIGLRNTHLRENYLEVGRGDGFSHAVLSEIALDGVDAGAFDGRTRFTGTLQLHGTRKAVAGEARLQRRDGGVEVEAGFPVALPDFGIPEPRYLGVGVRDQVQVTVRFTATTGATTTESR
jgi:polyisoprenoid-binding protein YceI